MTSDRHDEERRVTPGGASLREVRRAAGRTQLWVEAEAGLGTGYLQRLESGKVGRPGAETLARILDALGARFTERHRIMERFGYTTAIPLPTDADVAWARAEATPDLEGVAFPAYALDCAHRLIAWNRFLPCLLGVRPEHRAMQALARGSLIAHWFDAASPLAPLLLEPEVVLPQLARAMRVEMQRFRTEPWAATLVAELAATIPRFRALWAASESAPATASAARGLIPMRLRGPEGTPLSFHLSSEPFARDIRFRVIYLFPADPETMHQCAAWATG